MPPQKKRKSAEELLGITPRRKSAEELLGIQPPTPTPGGEGTGGGGVGDLQNLGTGGERGVLEYIQKPLATLGEAIYSGIRGDTRPIQEFAEIAGRGLLKQGAGLAGPPGTYEAVSATQDPQIAQVQAAQQARQQQVDPRLFGQIREKESDLAKREAADPSTRGKILRGAATLGVGAVPAVVAGIATGGSVPAIAAVTALQSAGDPENLALNVAGSVVPVPVGKAVSPILRRIRASRGTTVSPPPKSGGYTTQTVMVDGELPATVIQTGTPAPPGTVKVRYPDGATVNIKTDRITPMETAAMRATPETAPLDIPPVPTRREKIVSFLDEQEAAARARIQERRAPNVLRDISTVVPDTIDYSIIGAAKFGKGAIRYEQFAEEMLAEFGDEIKPRLRNIYNESKKRYNEQVKQVDAPTLGELTTKGETPSVVTAAKTAAAEAADSPLVQPSEKSSFLEIVTAARKAGLLTSAKTSMRNIASGIAFQPAEEIAKIPAAMIDIAMSAVTGKRTIAAPRIGDALSSVRAGVKAIPNALKMIKTGADPDDLVRMELGREIKSGSKIFDYYVNGVFRGLNAQDKVLKTVAYTNALRERARVQAINEARAGTIGKGQIGSRASELVNDPGEALRANARFDSELATFTNDNMLSGAIGRGREFLKGQPGGDVVNAAFDLVVPFTRTPINLIERMIDYSPLGLPKAAIMGAIKKKFSKDPRFSQEMQRNFALAFPRSAIGSGLIVLGYNLGLSNMATGLFERSEGSKNERDKAAGRPPGSILFGDTWYQLSGFAPFGNLIAIGASLAREDKREGAAPAYQAGQVSLPGIGATSAQIAGNALAEQPLLQGAEDTIELARRAVGPGTVNEPLGRFAGSFVPSIASDLAEAIDPMQREREGFAPQIQARIPGQMFGAGRQALPPAATALGQPLPDRGPFGAFLDPFNTRTATQNPIIQELVRLDQGLTKLQKKPSEPEEKYRERVGSFGEIYQQFGEQLLGNALYQKATDEQKAKALDSLSRRAKVQVNDEVEKGRRAGPRQARLNPQIIMRVVIDSERAKR